jgi:hypothetical protein
MNQRLRPAVSEPVFLMFSRRQVEACDIAEPLEFLSSLTADPLLAHDYCGRISLVVDGYNDDPREIFEVAEVRAFVKALDQQWPYWFFFLSQADDSIKLLESCLCDAIEVIPGVVSIDVEQMERSLVRHFAAMDRFCEAINLSAEKIEEISEGVISLIHNASVEKIDGDDYQL